MMHDMTTHWTVNELAKFLHVTRSTVQRRADRFSAFLDNKRFKEERVFTPKDVAVMMEVQRLAARGRSLDEIEPDIRGLALPDHIEFPDTSREREIELQMESKYLATLEMYKSRAESAEEELKEARVRIAYLEGQLSQQTSKEEVDSLNREIGKLQALLEIANQHNGEK